MSPQRVFVRTLSIVSGTEEVSGRCCSSLGELGNLANSRGAFYFSLNKEVMPLLEC